MTGIGFIIHDTGWAASTNVTFELVPEIVGQQEDKKYIIKDIKTLKFSGIFDGVGKVEQGQRVYCLFKPEEGGRQAFTGEVQGKRGENTIVMLHTTSEKFDELIKKIKGGN